MRAFVVEDDPDFRDLVRHVLEERGWQVEVAEDGIAALGRIRHIIPDVIVLDLLMPNLDGVEVLKLLRSTERGRRIPVVVVTGSKADADVHELASTVLLKPFEMAELLRAIERLTMARAE